MSFVGPAATENASTNGMIAATITTQLSSSNSERNNQPAHVYAASLAKFDGEVRIRAPGHDRGDHEHDERDRISRRCDQSGSAR